MQLLTQDAGDLVGPGPGGEGHDELHRMAGVILRGYHRCGACKSDRADELQHAASGKTREGSVSGRFGLSQAAPPYNEVVQITIGRRAYIPFLLLTRSEERSPCSAVASASLHCCWSRSALPPNRKHPTIPTRPGSARRRRKRASTRNGSRMRSITPSRAKRAIRAI